ncbi:hypothetical protein BDQ17DRAFT_1382989 [Cyathus striatus]|nr:hypothetical protein BDQ17DRAFT_1382989 [Cyathus striatus]
MSHSQVIFSSEFYKIEKEAQLGTSLGADALITGSLCILLAKSRSGFKNSLISILILFMINTGLLTMYYIIWPHNFIFMGSTFTEPYSLHAKCVMV